MHEQQRPCGRREGAGKTQPTRCRGEGPRRFIAPRHLAYMREIRREGMPARYVGERTRVRAEPHPRARANLPQVSGS